MTLDWGNPADTANRRLHLRDFYQYHGVEHGYEQIFDACERDVCKMLRSFGESTLSELKFNYYVDLVVWRRTFNTFEPSQQPQWPFRGVRDRFDECGPPSQVYSDFLAKERETASPTRTTTLSATSAEAEATPEVDEHTEEGNAVLEETQGPTSMDLNTAANPQAQQPAKASRRLDTTDHAADSTAERPAKRLYRAREPVYSRGFVQRLERRIHQLETTNRALKAASPTRVPASGVEVVQEPPGSDALAKEVSFLSTSAGGDRFFLGPTSGILFASLVKAGVLEDDSRLAATPSGLDAFGSPGAEERADDSLPPEQLARGLVDAYLAHDHLAYPFLHPGAIRSAVDCMYTDGPGRSHAFEAFMFNMILAIASSQASKLNWQAFPDANTHHQRAAKYLNAVLCNGGLKALQAMLLLCQFQLTSSTRDASASLWHVVGISARMCFELGLHREAVYQVARSATSPNDFEDNNVRRTCFWCVFALDREDVDVDMPSLGSGDASPPAGDIGAQDANVPSSRLALFKHIIRYRDICGRCLATLHRSGRNSTLPESEKARIRQDLADELQLWRADTDSLNLIEMDLSTPLAEARSSFRCKAWYELLYHNGVLLLYRPSYATMADNDDTNSNVFSAAKESIKLYSYLFRSRKINFSWMVLHAVFLAGLSYIYALSRHFREMRHSGRHHQLTPEPILVEIVNDCRACSNVLVAVSERCNSQKNCHEVFDRLSDAVVKDAVDALSGARRPPTARVAGPATSPPSQPTAHHQATATELPLVAGSADSVLRDCFPELQSMYDAQWGDDAILQLSTDWFNQTFPEDNTAYGWNMQS
ncbi:hypothetical protein PLIIFM63780_003346 [Purpureocillium lilacinum]|nr:hypothetical protein PLIIFM63780_003346 [Purpureocillium lilacinum]